VNLIQCCLVAETEKDSAVLDILDSHWKIMSRFRKKNILLQTDANKRIDLFFSLETGFLKNKTSTMMNKPALGFK
jgi:hypothetical protein